MHLAAAVDAGKHIFTEKPVAVDAAGSARSSRPRAREGRRISASSPARSAATRPSTSRPSSASTTARSATSCAARCSGTRAASGTTPRKPEWTDIEWQIRNWLYFTWLSGDHIVEQHVHNLDVANWVLNAHPVKRDRRRRTAVAHRAEVRPHLRSLRDRLRVPERRARHEHVPPDRRHAGQVGERSSGTKGRSSTRRTSRRASPARTRGSSSAAGKPVESVRAGAHGPHREHPSGQALNELKQSPRARSRRSWDARPPTPVRKSRGTRCSTPIRSRAADVGFGSLAVPPVPMPG